MKLIAKLIRIAIAPRMVSCLRALSLGLCVQGYGLWPIAGVAFVMVFKGLEVRVRVQGYGLWHNCGFRV